MAASLAAPKRSRFGASNMAVPVNVFDNSGIWSSRMQVFKSGPLFISSKGLGWKSWKKCWFILSRNTLVFFKNDPIALPQKGGEVNLTLGGIDLNNSGSVVVREDKKLLTVLFPDGRDGRAFTLKAETFEDLYEWKTALELALAQAPNAALVMGHDGIFRSETSNVIEESFSQLRDTRPVKPLVVGRPILLALEDIDGSPSFLEKALQFLEKYGTKVEGILRQSADVEEVVCRIQEYEQGKKDFSPDEDPHVVGDCVKHVLRELRSSPVPALCCTTLLEAYKIAGKEARISSLRSAIVEMFPEPNRRLLHRILKMMHTISSHSYENRMTSSAVAACMAPLLLRPLLAGECDLENGLDSNEDNSAQLLAAANAANSAQAIVATLLEDFENDEDLQRCSISADSQIGNSGPENSSDEEDIEKEDTSFCNAEIGVEQEANDDKVTLSRKWTEGTDLYDYKGFGIEDSDVESPRDIRCSIERSDLPMDHLTRNSTVLVNDQEGRDKKQIQDPIKDIEISSISPIDKHFESPREILTSVNPSTPLAASELASSTEKPASNITGAAANSKLSAFWDRGNVRKTPAKGSFDSSGDDELVIRRLEITKNDLWQRIAKEARGNSILQASLERRKQALHERRLALEQDVARLQEQLQAERDLRATLEVRLSMSCGQYSSHGVDSKTRAELEEIALAEADVARLKQKVAELHHQLNQQRHHQFNSFSDSCDYHPYIQHHNNQMRFLQQDFDSSLAFVNHEREQRIEKSILGAEWRNSRGLGFSASNMSMDQFSAIDSPSAPSTSRAVDIMEHPRHYHNPSSAALLELTTGLDFFKERRLQLMEQLQNLDLNNGLSSQDFIRRRPYSPPWN